jgi:hypothetical protein
MNRKTGLGVVLVVCLVCPAAAQSDPPMPKPDKAKTEAQRPRYPGGKLGDTLGDLMTVEGKYETGTWTSDNLLSVEVVNGKKLDKPVVVQVHGATIPRKGRCVLKGYENGEMIGVAPAVQEVAKEKGGEQHGYYVQAAWQWSTYFVALVAVEPKDLKIVETKK